MLSWSHTAISTLLHLHSLVKTPVPSRLMLPVKALPSCAPLCHGDVPTLSLYIPILMSTACVTSTWILRPNILAAGFLALFISIPSPPLPTLVVCFHCHSLDLVITQNSSSTFKIKNSDTSHLLFFQVIHSVISMKQLLEFI